MDKSNRISRYYNYIRNKNERYIIYNYTNDIIWNYKYRKLHDLKYLFNKKYKDIPDNKEACVIIFHDFEWSYATKNLEKYYTRNIESLYNLIDIEKFSDKACDSFLESENNYNINATYNIVGEMCEYHRDSVLKIIEKNHEIASHSYYHKDMRKLTEKEIIEELNKSKKMFHELSVNIVGFRTPMSKWNSKLIKSLHELKFEWNAEDGCLYQHPWYLKKNLLRIPVYRDDSPYLSSDISPQDLLTIFKNDIEVAKKRHLFLALGFHDWVEGISDERLTAFRKLMEHISRDKNITTKTFGEVAQYIRTQNIQHE